MARGKLPRDGLHEHQRATVLGGHYVDRVTACTSTREGTVTMLIVCSKQATHLNAIFGNSSVPHC
jgi:hypothetical protein